MRGEMSGRAFRIAEVLRKLPVFSAVAEGVDQHEEKGDQRHPAAGGDQGDATRSLERNDAVLKEYAGQRVQGGDQRKDERSDGDALPVPDQLAFSHFIIALFHIVSSFSQYSRIRAKRQENYGAGMD